MATVDFKGLMCYAVWLCRTWITWFVSSICLVVGACQLHSCFRSWHTAHWNCWSSARRSFPLSAIPYHCESSRRIQYLSFVD